MWDLFLFLLLQLPLLAFMFPQCGCLRCCKYCTAAPGNTVQVEFAGLAAGTNCNTSECDEYNATHVIDDTPFFWDSGVEDCVWREDDFSNSCNSNNDIVVLIRGPSSNVRTRVDLTVAGNNMWVGWDDHGGTIDCGSFDQAITLRVGSGPDCDNSTATCTLNLNP